MNDRPKGHSQTERVKKVTQKQQSSNNNKNIKYATIFPSFEGKIGNFLSNLNGFSDLFFEKQANQAAHQR